MIAGSAELLQQSALVNHPAQCNLSTLGLGDFAQVEPGTEATPRFSQSLFLVPAEMPRAEIEPEFNA